MTSDYVIRSFKPEQCVDFYTRVLGLKLYPSGLRRRVGQTDPGPQPVQQENPSTSNAELVADAMGAMALKPGKGALFRINHRRIRLFQKTAGRHGGEKAGTASVNLAGEMYFMARFPLPAEGYLRTTAGITRKCWRPVCAACGNRAAVAHARVARPR